VHIGAEPTIGARDPEDVDVSVTRLTPDDQLEALFKQRLGHGVDLFSRRILSGSCVNIEPLGPNPIRPANYLVLSKHQERIIRPVHVSD
jgi:hypothetical protein